VISRGFCASRPSNPPVSTFKQIHSWKSLKNLNFSMKYACL
jgi:hypothetical protein